MKKLTFISMVVFFIMSATGCARRVVVSDRPSPPVIVRPAQPAPDYIWIEGEWRVGGGKYSWRDGYWTRSRGHRTWAPGHWEATRGGYYWTPGRWR